MLASGSTLSRLNTLPGLLTSFWPSAATREAKSSERNATRLSRSGFWWCHAAIDWRKSVCCSGFNTLPASFQMLGFFAAVH
jgi:hypothetical protein